MQRGLFVGVGVAVIFATVLCGAVVVRRRRSSSSQGRDALADALEARLAETLSPGRGSHLERAPTVRRLAIVDGDGDESTFVPIVRIDLGTTDAPGLDLVFEYVADVLEAIHPALEERNARVDHYAVEFAFGPDGLLVDGECRRVAVRPELAAKLLEHDDYRAFDLRRDAERADRDDAVTSLWGECRSTVPTDEA